MLHSFFRRIIARYVRVRREGIEFLYVEPYCNTRSQHSIDCTIRTSITEPAPAFRLGGFCRPAHHTPDTQISEQDGRCGKPSASFISSCFNDMHVMNLLLPSAFAQFHWPLSMFANRTLSHQPTLFLTSKKTWCEENKKIFISFSGKKHMLLLQKSN